MSKRQSSALAIAALAVAVLGWTPLGEAARTAAFPSNSVGTVQLKANAVTSPKIRNRAVAGIDIQKQTIVNAHIKPGTLLASSFRAGQIPPGAKGEKGDKGDPGLSQVGLVHGFSASDSSTAKTAIAICPPGKTVISGGASITSLSGPGLPVALTGSAPVDGAWRGGAAEMVETAGNWSLSVWAICAVTTERSARAERGRPLQFAPWT